MNPLPVVPSWDGLHPLIIHFPIALLLVAPLLLVVGLFVRDGRPWAAAGLVLLALGTFAAWVAVSTGHAAGEIAERGPAAIERALERHEELAETTRTVFTALTLALAVLVVVPALLRRPLSRPVGMAATLVFLALYGGGALLLVGTAHQGGLLVHEFGVRAMVAAAPADPASEPLPAGVTPAGERRDENGHREEGHRDRD